MDKLKAAGFTDSDIAHFKAQSIDPQTVLDWINKYGAGIVKIIQELIALFSGAQADLTAQGVSHPAARALLPGKLDWLKIIGLIKQYGPSIITLILTLFGQKPPVIP